MKHKSTLGMLLFLFAGLSGACTSVHSYAQNSTKKDANDSVPLLRRNKNQSVPSFPQKSNRPNDNATLPTWVRGSDRTEVLVVPQPQEDETVILYEPAKGRPIKVMFTKVELSKFEKLLQTNNADEVKSTMSINLKEAGVECCEKRTKVGTCEWQCCDGSKCTTCNVTLKRVLTILWPVAKDG